MQGRNLELKLKIRRGEEGGEELRGKGGGGTGDSSRGQKEGREEWKSEIDLYRTPL